MSLVFSGKGQGRVSEATQEHVRRCARELGYRPNVAAQALRLGSSRAVALLVPDITNPFFSRVLRGAQRAARSAGYTVALVDTANDRRWEEQTFEALRAGPVDGYLLFEVDPPGGLGPDEHVVLMEGEAPGRPSVRFDAEGGAAAAFTHLVELGHERIGHLAAAFDAPTFHRRESARRRVLGEAGLDPDTQPRALTPISIEDARQAAGPLLDERPTAVYCDDDLIAAGLYLAARERGLRLPRRAVGRRLRRHGLRARARARADHRPARRGAARRDRLRVARAAHGGTPHAQADRAPGRSCRARPRSRRAPPA